MKQPQYGGCESFFYAYKMPNHFVSAIKENHNMDTNRGSNLFKHSLTHIWRNIEVKKCADL